MLKQANGSPLRTGLQVASVYAVNNGYLDSVHVEHIQGWEKAMHTYMLSSGKDVVEALEKGWDDEIEESLKKALTSFAHTHSN